MPLIRVVSRRGRPPPVPLQASFGPDGGTLGRSPDCTLALPDEDRHISRRQARIDVASGSASITCLSAGNPLIINGHELRHGQTRPLAHGDRIHVAEYEMRFEENDGQAGAAVGHGAIPDDPFALPDWQPPQASSARGAGQGEARRGLIDDPFAESPPQAQVIPHGFDPFAEPGAPPQQSDAAFSPRSRADPLGLGLEADPMAELAGGRADSIDALFDLQPGMDPLGPDSPLGRPLGEKPRPGSSGAADRAGDPIPDNASVLSSSFRLPQAIPATGFGAADEPVVSWKKADAPPPADRPPVPGRGAVERALRPKGIHEPAGDPLGLGLDPDPVSRVGPKARAQPLMEAEAPYGQRSDALPQYRPAADGAAPPSGAHRFPTQPVAGDMTDPSGLLDALLRGLGIAELPRVSREGGASPQTLTPELMERLGVLLATACDGTVELLQARATLKQELRADVTMIQAQDNNPLKFAPEGHVALDQLLKPNPVKGFMEPRLAMRDAYDDLLAHQIGFVAGMRAAMQGLVGRFDPAVLEKRLAAKSMLGAMLPAARKARLWDLFNSLYAEVAQEAEDDFQRLFGRAFVQAYEEQIARLEKAPSPRGRGSAGPRG
jgi:FHA domain-containing protein